MNGVARAKIAVFAPGVRRHRTVIARCGAKIGLIDRARRPARPNPMGLARDIRGMSGVSRWIGHICNTAVLVTWRAMREAAVQGTAKMQLGPDADMPCPRRNGTKTTYPWGTKEIGDGALRNGDCSDPSPCACASSCNPR